MLLGPRCSSVLHNEGVASGEEGINICRARMKATKPLGLAGNKSEYFMNETQFRRD